MKFIGKFGFIALSLTLGACSAKQAPPPPPLTLVTKAVATSRAGARTAHRRSATRTTAPRGSGGGQATSAGRRVAGL